MTITFNVSGITENELTSAGIQIDIQNLDSMLYSYEINLVNNSNNASTFVVTFNMKYMQTSESTVDVSFSDPTQVEAVSQNQFLNNSIHSATLPI